MRRAAYTLIELMVVAAIILVLAGILLVVVRKILQLIHQLFGADAAGLIW